MGGERETSLTMFLLGTEEQAQFNKFVREEVSKKFGEDFLLEHEVNQLESSIMELIKGLPCILFTVEGSVQIEFIQRGGDRFVFAQRYYSGESMDFGKSFAQITQARLAQEAR